MKIIDLLHKRPTLSFEIFPPKNYDGDISSIYQTIDELSKLNLILFCNVWSWGIDYQKYS